MMYVDLVVTVGALIFLRWTSWKWKTNIIYCIADDCFCCCCCCCCCWDFCCFLLLFLLFVLLLLLLLLLSSAAAAAPLLLIIVTIITNDSGDITKCLTEVLKLRTFLSMCLFIYS